LLAARGRHPPFTTTPFLTSGSGFYAALAVRRALEEMVRVPVDLERAPDFLDHRPPIFRDDAHNPPPDTNTLIFNILLFYLKYVN